MENSKIEWTNHTFNPWIGCTKVSDGCKNCYAESLMGKRLKRVKWGVTGTRVRTSEAYWKQPIKWNRKAEKSGKRAKVFCASLADVFEDKLDQPEMNEWRDGLFALIDATPHLDWLLLTKRPENIKRLWPFGWYDYSMSWDNIWIGTSVENQEQADKRIPELLKIPARVRFLSIEPLLEKVLLDNGETSWLACNGTNMSGIEEIHECCESYAIIGEHFRGIDWVIVGGESGPNARPMDPDWARGIRDQCEDASVPFFFKQWGEFRPNSFPDIADGPPFLHRFSDGLEHGFVKVGKQKAGRLLDGREWSEFPNVMIETAVSELRVL